jgi:phosphatidate cytidylyltransferase
MGTHLILPSISPHKTWEGALGGFFASCIGLTMILWKLQSYHPIWVIVSFAFIVSSLSILGDLFESYLKRQANIKDSGVILPGHGGFLDRFDGILFAVFFFYIFKRHLLVLFNL